MVVIGYLIAAGVAIAVTWAAAGRGFKVVRDPKPNLGEVTGRHVPIMGTLAGFAVISHWVPFLLGSVAVGGLNDRYDSRRIIQCGMALFITASVGWGYFFLTDTLELCEILLEQAKVAIVPGEAFGEPGYARLSFALGDDDLREGVSRIADFLV